MRNAHILISLVGLLVGLLMVVVGIFLFTIPHVVPLFQVAQSILLHHLKGLSYCGLSLFILGLLFLLLLFLLNRRHYLLLKMAGVSIDEKVIACLAHQHLQAFFPHDQIKCDIAINGQGTIEVMANLPILPEDQQLQTLQEIENKLGWLLLQQFQYDRPFIFNVSFF